jgi:hypothetical protein
MPAIAPPVIGFAETTVNADEHSWLLLLLLHSDNSNNAQHRKQTKSLCIYLNYMLQWSQLYLLDSQVAKRWEEGAGSEWMERQLRRLAGQSMLHQL